MYEKKIPKDFSCGIAVMMEIIGGKWKSYLIFLISQGVRRPSDLQRAVPSATRRVLNLQLRELEFHGIIKRVIYPELPPKVEYYLTEFGSSILPVVEAMDNWGAAYLEVFRELMERKKSSLLMQAAETAAP
jgi:DNA-binding HxlR family transcriptional regulator